MLFHAIVAAFVMLLPKFHHVVTQGQQKMIIAKMMGLIKSSGFRYQVFVVFYQFGRNIERPSIVRSNIQFLGRGAPGFRGKYRMNSPDCTGESTSRSSGTGANEMVSAGLAADRQRRVEFPTAGSVKSGIEDQIGCGPAFWIKNHLVPHQDEEIGCSGGTEINRRPGSRNQESPVSVDRGGSRRDVS